MKDFKLFKFCRSNLCKGLRADIDGVFNYCPCHSSRCLKTAKELYLWLPKNGFQIVKVPGSEESAVEYGQAVGCEDCNGHKLLGRNYCGNCGYRF